MIRYTLSWLTYWLGDIASHLVVWPIAIPAYHVYSKLMWWSVKLQKGERGPWLEPVSPESAEYVDLSQVWKDDK